VACIPAGIDDGESSTELLLCLEVGDEAVGWAGPIGGLLLLGCGIEGTGQRDPRKGKKRNSFPVYSFGF
jgi:hypothetical protein